MDELHLNAVSSRKVGRELPETCWPTAGTKGGKGLVKNRRHKEASELTEKVPSKQFGAVCSGLGAQEVFWKRGEVALLSPEGSHERSASVY